MRFLFIKRDDMHIAPHPETGKKNKTAITIIKAEYYPCKFLND